MALHAPLSQFLGRLNTDLGAGTGGEFLAATGRRLVASQVLPEEEFSRQLACYPNKAWLRLSCGSPRQCSTRLECAAMR